MNAQLTTAIASHLQISPNQIKAVQEWASVYFVRFTKGSPRFVSKKIQIQMEEEMSAEEFVQRCNERIRVHQVSSDVIALAVALKGCDAALGNAPAGVWESHAVISQYLHLKDRQIGAAIDVACSF